GRRHQAAEFDPGRLLGHEHHDRVNAPDRKSNSSKKGIAMTPNDAHLWAVAYDDSARAEHVRQEIVALAGPANHLLLLDIAILARDADGSYTLDRDPFPVTGNVLGGATLGFLAGLALAAPMTGAAVGALLGTAASSVANAVQMEESFIRDVGRLMKPGTS